MSTGAKIRINEQSAKYYLDFFEWAMIEHAKSNVYQPITIWFLRRNLMGFGA